MVKYTYQEKEYNKQIFVQDGSTKYIENQPIKIKVLKKDPSVVAIDSLSGLIVGFIFLGVSALVFGGSYLNYYMTSKYKTYAAAKGLDTVSNAVFRR